MSKFYTKHNSIILFFGKQLATTVASSITCPFYKLSGLFDALLDRFDPQGVDAFSMLAGVPSIQENDLLQYALILHTGNFRNCSPYSYSILS
jgi:hypothetical protein